LRHKSLALFMTHRGALVDYASGIMGDRTSGEDVVQEAWLRFDAAGSRRLFEEPLGYLYRVVRNLALDGRRRRQREALVLIEGGFETAAERSPDNRPTPEAVALHKDEYDLVMEVIAELPERTRIALEMHRFGGAKLREIATVLDISLSLAHVLVADGIRRCRKRLDRL
jgi:RNA polymerase sigma factor (sigma-70 family)